MEIKIGADPELWIYDNDAKRIISAVGLFPGTKDQPHKVERGAIQVDGMAAEYNINPANCREEFVYNNLSVLRSLRDEIRDRNPGLNFGFVFDPVAEFGAEYIAQQPDIARALGCSPDYNAWEGGKENPIPDAEMPFRTASGHIHLGWGDDLDINDPEHIEACCMMSKQLDCYLAARLLGIEGAAGRKRRELYGKAGAFRPKKYGVEYRTLSNVWLRTVNNMSDVYAIAAGAFNSLIEKYAAYDRHPEKLVEVINKGLIDDAEDYFDGWYNNQKSNLVTVKSIDGHLAKWEKMDDMKRWNEPVLRPLPREVVMPPVGARPIQPAAQAFWPMFAAQVEVERPMPVVQALVADAAEAAAAAGIAGIAPEWHIVDEIEEVDNDHFEDDDFDLDDDDDDF